jgi:hypothetical protein
MYSLLTVAVMIVAASPAEPQVVGTFPENEADVVRLPDGTLKIFYNQRGEYVGSLTSRDDGRTWSEPVKEFAVSGETAHAIQVLLDRKGELQVYYLVIRRGGRKIAVDLFLDLWMCATSDGRTKWNEPRLAVPGAIGALRGIVQTKSGRIVVPFSTADPAKKPGPPEGYFYTTAVYSDDDGTSWKQSPSRLTAPCYDGYNGGNYGAVEPTIVELDDGRLWMLIRTQTGKMYESFSKDGAEWSAAVESQFYGSNSPAMLRRLDDGRLFVAWNNAQVAPKFEGQGVYSGRDALHVAVSPDDGKTWRGFREVYRDPTRHGEGVELRNDRGTAYPDAVQTKEGAIVLVTGQGEGRRAILRFDPAWITATHRDDDFSHGLDGWHAFQEYGPATRFFRARRAAGQIVPHPDDPNRRMLRLAPRPADAAPPGTSTTPAAAKSARPEPVAATWNFPAGRRGSVTLRVRAENGSPRASVAIADRLISPTDATDEKDLKLLAHFECSEKPGSDTALKPGRTHEVKFQWDVEKDDVRATVDGAVRGVWTALEPGSPLLSHGACYLVIRLKPSGSTTAGLAIESVSADVEP